MNYVKLEYQQNGDGADCCETENIFVSKASPTIVLWENDAVEMRIHLAHALKQGKPVIYRHSHRFQKNSHGGYDSHWDDLLSVEETEKLYPQIKIPVVSGEIHLWGRYEWIQEKKRREAYWRDQWAITGVKPQDFVADC